MSRWDRIRESLRRFVNRLRGQREQEITPSPYAPDEPEEGILPEVYEVERPLIPEPEERPWIRGEREVPGKFDGKVRVIVAATYRIRNMRSYPPRYGWNYNDEVYAIDIDPSIASDNQALAQVLNEMYPERVHYRVRIEEYLEEEI